jgi:hypothetical protein
MGAVQARDLRAVLSQLNELVDDRRATLQVLQQWFRSRTPAWYAAVDDGVLRYFGADWGDALEPFDLLPHAREWPRFARKLLYHRKTNPERFTLFSFCFLNGLSPGVAALVTMHSSGGGTYDPDAVRQVLWLVERGFDRRQGVNDTFQMRWSTFEMGAHN